MSDIKPPVPADADLRGLPGFMLDTSRLLGSELWALSTGDQFKAAMALWCRAWQQVPAGSLPDDDAVLKAFSGAGSKWAKIRDVALRGFVKCSDGRLYHTVLCQDVARAIESKRKRHERVQAAVNARKKQRDDDRDVDRNDERDVQRDVEQSTNVTTSHNRTGQDRTEVRKKESPSPSAIATGDVAPLAREPDLLAPQGSEMPDIPAFLDRRGKAWARMGIEELPDEWRQFCETERPDLDPQGVWDRFCDHWKANGKPMKDWLAAWRNWVRRERLEHGRKLGTSAGQPDAFLAAARAVGTR